DRNADPADLALGVLGVGVEADLCGQVERHGETGAALLEQVAVARVRLLGRAEARVLAERPEPPAVAGLEVAAREGEPPGLADPLVGRQVVRPVDRLHRDAAVGGDRGRVDFGHWIYRIAMPDV